MGVGDDVSGFGADADSDDDEVFFARPFDEGEGVADGVFPIAEDDEGVGGVRRVLFEGVQRAGEDVVEVGSSIGGPAAVDLFDGFAQCVVVVGEGDGELCISGEDDEAEVVVRQGVHQFIGGRAGLFEAGGGDVPRFHGAGDVDGKHDVAAHADVFSVGVAAVWAGEGDDDEGQCEQAEGSGEVAAPRGRADEEFCFVGFGDEGEPAVVFTASRYDGCDCQQERQDEEEQDFRVQKVHAGSGGWFTVRDGGGGCSGRGLLPGRPLLPSGRR